MPYLSIQTNIDLDEAKQQTMLQEASNTVATQLGKPESYVMVALQPSTPMSFGGDHSPTAYLKLKSLGLPESETGPLSQALCTLIMQQLAIPAQRVYIEFSSPERHLWGWNSTTF